MAEAVPAHITYRIAKARYLARVDGGEEFLVGVQVPYQTRIGLMNEEIQVGKGYNPSDYRAQFDFWADFIGPTAVCESHGSFVCLNTYDRAAVTFGFLQFAAHEPNGDFVQWFRSLLVLPDAHRWFPDLSVNNAGRITRHDRGRDDVLEDDTSTAKLMAYLNPTPDAVDEAEVLAAAKLIAWHTQNPTLAGLQLQCGIRIFQRAMSQYARQYALNNQSAAICAVIADIRHQGRASSQAILTARQISDPAARLDALFDVGRDVDAGRCQTLRVEISKWAKAGTFDKLVYDAGKSAFVRQP